MLSIPGYIRDGNFPHKAELKAVPFKVGKLFNTRTTPLLNFKPQTNS